jgi:hypothetical protein
VRYGPAQTQRKSPSHPFLKRYTNIALDVPLFLTIFVNGHCRALQSTG